MMFRDIKKRLGEEKRGKESRARNGKEESEVRPVQRDQAAQRP